MRENILNYILKVQRMNHSFLSYYGEAMTAQFLVDVKDKCFDEHLINLFYDAHKKMNEACSLYDKAVEETLLKYKEQSAKTNHTAHDNC